MLVKGGRVWNIWTLWLRDNRMVSMKQPWSRDVLYQAKYVVLKCTLNVMHVSLINQLSVWSKYLRKSSKLAIFFPAFSTYPQISGDGIDISIPRQTVRSRQNDHHSKDFSKFSFFNQNCCDIALVAKAPIDNTAPLVQIMAGLRAEERDCTTNHSHGFDELGPVLLTWVDLDRSNHRTWGMDK